jgi:uncharacterized iron-regulated protein
MSKKQNLIDLDLTDRMNPERLAQLALIEAKKNKTRQQNKILKEEKMKEQEQLIKSLESWVSGWEWQDYEPDVERYAITFERLKDGPALLKITFTNQKVISIHRYKPDVLSTVKNQANKILDEIILANKKKII